MKGTQILFDRESTDGIEYVGISASGVDVDYEQWQIKAIEKDGNGKPVSIKYAKGSADYSFVWSDRTEYTYM